MKRPNKTRRRQRQRRQRSRRNRISRRQRGGYSIPEGALVGVRTDGEYGMPTLMSLSRFQKEKEKGSLEE